MHAMLTYWITYFLPVYFQAVKEASPIRSGVDLVPSAVTGIPFAILAGGGLSTLNRYRPFHFTGFAFLILACGLLTLLDASSSEGDWVGFQILGAAGVGTLLTTTLPALQAPLSEADVAVATATWAQVNHLITSRLSDDPELQARLANGGAYELATKEFITSLRIVWYVALAFALLGFLVAFVLKEVPMREDLETEFWVAGEEEGVGRGE
ncbi:uncharacterized protein BO80DRAFT_495292 [Aspergillus ibericus CBS 121593]|uniref:MFS general substrate transporter n=1 Tax=Aspergillus ibericus CBS 121593 TaxID=1448316 RepID=A0A395GUQ9_9EURO|nr:hypothetical protein BO80DRAFT_495292 [Aspergillus ibericus CBS 121593]RAK98718.1 hypothetical protein BO80DRAFT_495292 [Aspergillus ibericus CBS 121593]